MGRFWTAASASFCCTFAAPESTFGTVGLGWVVIGGAELGVVSVFTDPGDCGGAAAAAVDGGDDVGARCVCIDECRGYNIKIMNSSTAAMMTAFRKVTIVAVLTIARPKDRSQWAAVDNEGFVRVVYSRRVRPSKDMMPEFEGVNLSDDKTQIQ